MAKFLPDKSEHLIQSAKNFEWLARMKDLRAKQELQELSLSSGWQRHRPSQIGLQQEAEARPAEQRPAPHLEMSQEAMRQLERRGLREQRLDHLAALLATVIWVAGFAVLWWLWDNRIFVPDLMETLLGFVMFWIALFYALAWFPIRDYVSERLARRAGAKKC